MKMAFILRPERREKQMSVSAFSLPTSAAQVGPDPTTPKHRQFFHQSTRLQLQLLTGAPAEAAGHPPTLPSSPGLPLLWNYPSSSRSPSGVSEPAAPAPRVPPLHPSIISEPGDDSSPPRDSISNPGLTSLSDKPGSQPRRPLEHLKCQKEKNELQTEEALQTTPNPDSSLRDKERKAGHCALLPSSLQSSGN